MDKVHVVYGPDWAVECKDRADAKRALALCDSEGVEAHYKHTLRAVYALIVEFYPKNAGLGDGPRAVRRHKWAYCDNGWVKGAPAIFNANTGEVDGMYAHKREHSAVAAHVWYNAYPLPTNNTGCTGAARDYVPHIDPTHIATNVEAWAAV